MRKATVNVENAQSHVWNHSLGYPGYMISKWRKENTGFKKATNVLRAQGQVMWNLGNMMTFGQLGFGLEGARFL